ncbi:MAG: hypothetical protein DRJ97_01115 [Thermoprotei archaeon]|nr:MAG: hypothetical protein DRJ97_01115 [Thermoprotei archaeon]
MIDPLCLSLAEELSRRVYEVAQSCDCLLLSGGVDTTFVAAASLHHGHRFNLAVTVTYKGMGEDVRYASLVARRLGLSHVVVEYDDAASDEVLDDVILVLNTFDPVEVRGSVSVYVALREALARGCRRVATGDGGDELFAGYDFLLDKAPGYVDDWIKNMVGRWRFSSIELSRRLGLEVVPVYVDEEIVRLALRVPYSCRVLEAYGRLWGKALLRLWLDRAGFKEVAWRRKDPIEGGSGSRALSLTWASRVTHEDVEEVVEEGLNLPSRSHVYLYRRYRRLGLRVPKPSANEKPCPICGGPLKGSFCRFCGAYLDEEGRVHVYNEA